MPEPLNPRLYNRVKKEAQEKFRIWPSVYGSSWLVTEYKRRGGKYKGSRESTGLKRWYAEQWINVCHLPKKVSCGRPSLDSAWKKQYPYCRPSVRVNSRTPRTVSELSRKELAARCKTKRSAPLTRVNNRT